MLGLATKTLVLIFALSASPLDALSAIATGRAAPPPTGEVSVSEALASLSTPISEARFFKLLNASNSPGYLVGGAQGGANLPPRLVPLSISVIRC